MLSWALASVGKQDPGLISEERDGEGQRAGRDIQSASRHHFVFVFPFQMNNSVAMPRLKYFSVFSKM